MAFPEGNIPKYGTAMMQPKYCGKWAVSNMNYFFFLPLLKAQLGFGSPSQGVEERSNKQSSDLHEISQTPGDARVSPE